MYYINGALNNSTNYNERDRALFQKAFVSGKFEEKIDEAIIYLDEIINKNEKDNKGDVILYIKSLHYKGYLYGRKNRNKEALEIYSMIIDKFENFNNVLILDVIKSSLLNKIEMNIIENTKNTKKDLDWYFELVKDEKNELIQYDMLVLMEKAKEQIIDEKIISWKDEFKNVLFKNNWSFEELKTWANSFEDEKVKNRLLCYIDVFESHNKNIKED